MWFFKFFILGDTGEKGERGFPGQGPKGLPGTTGLPGKYQKRYLGHPRNKQTISH